MNHKLKQKTARKMRTKEDIKKHIPLFQTEAWEKRREAIRNRVLKQQALAHQRAVE